MRKLPLIRRLASLACFSGRVTNAKEVGAWPSWEWEISRENRYDGLGNINIGVIKDLTARLVTANDYGSRVLVPVRRDMTLDDRNCL